MDDQSLQQQPYLTFFDEDTAEYDVIVDQSSSAPNLKEATWGALQPLLPLVSERMGPDEFGLILEYSPLPESFLEKFKAIQEKAAQQPPPPDPEMMKIQAMQQAKQAELQMKQQEAQAQMQMDQQAAQHQAQVEQGKTAAQIQLEREKAAAQIQLEREKAQAQLELEMAKAQAQLQMDQQRMAFDADRSKQEMAMKARGQKHDMALKTATTRSNIENGAVKTASEASDDDEGEGMDVEDMDLFGNKALAQSMQAMSEAIVQMAKANAESQRMMAEGIAGLGSELKDAMTKPKTIVRGPDGRAIGVQ
jgi:hypothetical protein